MNSTLIELPAAFTIAEKMVKPWKHATYILAGLFTLFMVLAYVNTTEVDLSSIAKDVTASVLETSTVLKRSE